MPGMSRDLPSFSGRRVLVTGASGFIGSHLLRRLQSCGAELHAVTREDRSSDEAGLRWWSGDLAETGAVRNIVSAVRPEVLFHLASNVTGSRDLGLVLPTFQSNLISTVNLLTSAAECGCSRFILAGSMEEPVSGCGDPVPCSPYAAAKWAATGYARMFHALYGLPAVIVRIFMVYGPGQRDIRKLIPSVILSLLRGEAPRLSSGRRPVDWIFVEDVVDGLIAAASAADQGGATVDLGSGMLVTVREIAERLARLVDPAIAPQFGAIEDRPLETVRSANTTHTERLIGWKLRTTLDEGLERTVEWYRQNQSLFDGRERFPLM